MWWLVLLLLAYFLWMKRREGMSPSAYEMSLAQVGQIQKMDEQLIEKSKFIQISNNTIDELDKSIQINIANTLAMDSNMAQSKVLKKFT